MSFLAYSKNFQGVADVLLRDPVRYLPFAQLLDVVMSTESDLTQAQREMIALYSSRLNHCGYCVDSHSCVLTGLGTDETLVNALADSSLGPVDDKMQRILAFAGKLTLEPGKVTKTDIETVRAAGWSTSGRARSPFAHPWFPCHVRNGKPGTYIRRYRYPHGRSPSTRQESAGSPTMTNAITRRT